MRLTRPSALQLLSRAHTQAWPEPAACWQLKSRRFHGCSSCEIPAEYPPHAGNPSQTVKRG